jgi:hypothetical protein
VALCVLLAVPCAALQADYTQRLLDEREAERSAEIARLAETAASLR